MLRSMQDNLRVAIIGASGGIGSAFIQALEALGQTRHIYALSRQPQNYDGAKITSLAFDFTNETSVQSCAAQIEKDGPLDLVIIATGFLHNSAISPEKNMRALSFESFEKNFAINTFGPALTAKYFLPLMNRKHKAVFAALSARVGSISDNRLGGWYSYRASKAALNMVLKTLSIEYGRRFKNIIIAGLHPGTVDTKLSKPFQQNVAEGKLFTPDYSAKKLLSVIDQMSFEDSGKILDWAGQIIPP